MKVKELLAKPKNWTKGTLARDQSGTATYVHNPFAESWCLVGAIEKCYPKLNAFELMKIHNLIESEIGIGYPLALFNDSADTTHEKILDLLTKLDI